MKRRIWLFFIFLILSFPLWLAINFFEKKLEDFFYWQEVRKNYQIFTATANLEKQLEELKPTRNRTVSDLTIEGKSVISILIYSQGDSRILFEKEKDKKQPIASLTKLMTALVVVENYDPKVEIEISKESVLQEEDIGNLKIGEKFSVANLLYPLLMESSNDAAYALAEIIGEKNFVDLMNITAAKLNLKDTFFVNPTGLDPDNPSDPINYATAEDLVKLANYSLEKTPLIWEILATPEFDLYLPDGVLHHKLKNINELLKEIPQIGGKTGWTPQAQGCLLLVYQAPENKGKIINVILGSKDRFGEMKKMIEWLNKAYRW